MPCGLDAIIQSVNHNFSFHYSYKYLNKKQYKSNQKRDRQNVERKKKVRKCRVDVIKMRFSNDNNIYIPMHHSIL